jgi:hypothetical protein
MRPWWTLARGILPPTPRMKLTREAHMRENGNGHLELLRWRAPTGYAAALTALLMRSEAKDPATHD